MLAGEAVIKVDLIMDPLAVRAAVQEMLSATRVEEDSYTLDRLKEKNVTRCDGRQGMLHGPANRVATGFYSPPEMGLFLQIAHLKWAFFKNSPPEMGLFLNSPP